MIQVPPYLKPGDTIGIVCPAGFMPEKNTVTCQEALKSWGYHVRLGDTVRGASENYFSGSDEERCRDLQAMLDDPSINAILFGRGGYGTSRIIDQLDFTRFVQHPKWLIGFSDITVILQHVYANYSIAGLHAPMAAAFNNSGATSENVRSLREAISGMPARYQVLSHSMNRKGTVTAPLAGGNLSLLAHMIGSRSELNFKSHLLFIEDVGEQLYHLDRMLLQLRRAGQLESLAGLIVGGFTEMKDTERPFGKTLEEIIFSHVKEYEFPVCFDFPVSHGVENRALKIGAVWQLEVGNAVCLSEFF